MVLNHTFHLFLLRKNQEKRKYFETISTKEKNSIKINADNDVVFIISNHLHVVFD